MTKKRKTKDFPIKLYVSNPLIKEVNNRLEFSSLPLPQEIESSEIDISEERKKYFQDLIWPSPENKSGEETSK